jgi:hypothetical protein
VLSPIGSQTANEGALLSFTVTGSDPDAGDTLTYSASNLPSGASFDPATQTFTWTPGYDQAGNHVVTFQVTDAGALSDSEDVTITVGDVNRPPVLNPIGNKTTSVGVALTFTVTGSDPDGDGLTFSADLSALPSGATFNPATQTFTWTPTDSGTYSPVIFTVEDDGTPVESDSETLTITVNP